MDSKVTTFSIEEIKDLDWAEYDEKDYMVADILFLSTRPNSHKLQFSEEVLEKYAKSILGKWIIADIQRDFFGRTDATSHTNSESVKGLIPKEQSIRFVRADDGYLDAYVYGVISKLYSKDACDIFQNGDQRNVSIEFSYSSDENDENIIVDFDIKGITILGKSVSPSVPNANMKIVRFSAEEANKCFERFNNRDALSTLKQFAEQRRADMADKKTYKIDKSKEAVSNTPWGDVNKISMRNKIMEASNRDSLVKSVYLLVEDGWQEAPSEHLKYPCMELKGDTFVYNANALSSALGYAKKENETTVINKVEQIRKKLDLDDSNGKEEMAMDENKEKLEAEMAEETEEKKEEMACEEDCDDHCDDDDKHDDDEHDDEEKAEMFVEQMQKDIEDRDNIIMEKDKKIAEYEAELAELREFKASVEKKEIACSVDSVLAEVKDCMSEEKFNELKEEGMACNKETFAAFANKARACAFENVKGKAKKNDDGIMKFGLAVDTTNDNKSGSVWDRI